MVLLPENADPQNRLIDLPGAALGAAALAALSFAIISGETRGYGAGWRIETRCVRLVLQRPLAPSTTASR
jgi:hypothetical protein